MMGVAPTSIPRRTQGGPTISEKRTAADPSRCARPSSTSPYDIVRPSTSTWPYIVLLVASALVAAAALFAVHGHIASRAQQLAAQEQAARAAAEQAELDARLVAEAQRLAALEADKGREPVTIDLVMVGDILMHDEVVENGLQVDRSYGYDFIFEHLGDLVTAADVRILNQETVMGLPEKGYDMDFDDEGSPVFNTPVELIDAEMRAGFNVILKATNHTFDQQYEGLAHELGYWCANYPDVPVLGVDNPDDRRGPQDWVHNVYMFEKDGFKVAILNYTFGTNDLVDYKTERDVLAYLDETKIKSDVAKARSAGADMIVACPHWGIEYRIEPSPEEQRYSELFCELGVDVVFGTHPHIMQPVEVLTSEKGHRTVCFFSNGNFVAADGFNANSLITGISRATLVKEPDGTCRVVEASLTPMVVCHGGRGDMSVYPIAEYPDDLAERSNRPQLTAAYADEFCADLFGPGYDVSAHVYTVDLG